MEFRQFYFGSLLDDSNTFLREWPHVHFKAAIAVEVTPRTHRSMQELPAVQKFADGAPGLIDGHLRVGAGAGRALTSGGLFCRNAVSHGPGHL